MHRLINTNNNIWTGINDKMKQNEIQPTTMNSHTHTHRIQQSLPIYVYYLTTTTKWIQKRNSAPHHFWCHSKPTQMKKKIKERIDMCKFTNRLNGRITILFFRCCFRSFFFCSCVENNRKKREWNTFGIVLSQVSMRMPITLPKAGKVNKGQEKEFIFPIHDVVGIYINLWEIAFNLMPVKYDDDFSF